MNIKKCRLIYREVTFYIPLVVTLSSGVIILAGCTTNTMNYILLGVAGLVLACFLTALWIVSTFFLWLLKVILRILLRDWLYKDQPQAVMQSTGEEVVVELV